MNDFYKQPKLLLWIEAILLLTIGFIPALVVIELGYNKPIFYFFLLIYIPIAQFAFTPFFTLIGIYKYYSPMLLGYMVTDKLIDLHSGSSFDFFFVMRKYKPGNEVRNRLLIFHLEGLITIIRLIENKNIPESIHIVGTSYFFNDRTLHKMGFDILNPSIFLRLNLFVNFIDLVWMYSYSKGKFAIPKIGNAKKARISGAKLLDNKMVIEELYTKMKRKTAEQSS